MGTMPAVKEPWQLDVDLWLGILLRHPLKWWSVFPGGFPLWAVFLFKWKMN
jgi:hypothetical protein